jgi:hypothetical protein
MLKTKTLVIFLIVASVIYGILSAPVEFYDKQYGAWYRKIATWCFSEFRDNGFVKFREGQNPATTRVNMGNYGLVKPNGKVRTVYVDINTRYLGYMPTILLISLVLASPVPILRRLIALVTGLAIVTLLVIFKQWIALMWLAQQTDWLGLVTLTGTKLKMLTFANTSISIQSSTVLYFVVIIWLLVTFRVDDFRDKKPAPRNPVKSK